MYIVSLWCVIDLVAVTNVLGGSVLNHTANWRISSPSFTYTHSCCIHLSILMLSHQFVRFL
jgi:hypothetical protein